jgi:copper(I)-binding protein
MSTSVRILRGLPLALLLLGLQSAWADVTVKDAWVRGTVDGQTSTGAYMVISTDRDVELTSAETPLADHAQVHAMQMHGDMMMMMPVERLGIAAGKSLTLDEKNYHLMLDGLHRAVHAGDHVPLSLTFVDARGTRLQVPVDAVTRGIASHGDSMDGMDDHMNHH